MAILKKTSFKQNLDQISVYVNDVEPNSQYFRVTDLPDTFTGGKNAFLIQGSENLVGDTLVKIEIKDAVGNVIYSEPSAGIPSYYEGTSKVVSVHVYPDTAFGPCTITILGELGSTTIDGINVPIPLDWVGKYNVKWQKVINVNPFKTNTTPIRFYRRPQVQVTESVLPIYNRSVTSITVSGSINGTSIIPIQDTDYRTYKGPISYELSTTASFFSQSMEGFNINVSGLSSSYSPLLTDVINDKKALVSLPYYITGSTPDPFYERIRNFSNKPFTLTYDESVTITNSNINSSFARIKITDLETFTGDASRIKVYASSKNDLGDFQLLEDALLESSEILQVDEFNGTLNVRTGVFSQPILDSFWQTENITTSPIVSIDNSLLIRSVKLQPTTDVASPVNLQGLFKFTTTGSIQLSKFTEYQLDVTPLMSSSLGNYALLEIYGSGSAFVNSSNSNTFGKLLGELETNNPFRRYDRQQINFRPDVDGDGKIVFLVKAGTWHLSGISLRAAQESSFSPNEISLVVNVPTKINNETFDFKFEIYDVNNNYVPITLQTSSVFVGGNDVSVTRNLELSVSNNSFNFGDGTVLPSFITIDFTKSGLTGSVTFNSAAVDTTGNDIPSQAGYPGGLEVIDSDTFKLTAASFTGSISGITVGAISYTASCEDINRYFTIFRTEQGAPAYLFYATADKNNFTFNPDAGNKSVTPNDYIDIRLVQQNLPDNAPMGLVIYSGSEFGTPPPIYYTGSVGNASIYRLFVSTSADTTPSNKSGYTFAIGQSTYDFELHTIDGIFTSSVTIDAISKGDAAKGIIATSDKNQFFYKMSDATADPSPQSATLLVKRLNLTSLSSSITVNSGSGKPALTLVSNNVGNGVAQYSISTTSYPYSAGATTYYFTGSDSNGVEYIDEVTIDALINKSQIGVLASNENATLSSYSTGFVPSASFIATTGSIQVTVGNETASVATTLTTNRFSASISASSGVANPSINGSTYTIGQLTADTGSVTINVAYQDATGTIVNFPKIITYSKAKKAAPVLTLNITNNNQAVNAKSTGVQLSEFATASIEVLETYDGITAAKPINGTPTITTLYGYSNFQYNSTTQGVALRTLSTDFEQLGITLNVTDSENVIRQLEGSISLSKVRNAVPNVEVSLVPVAQTILANSRGSGSVTPSPITVTAAEGGTSRFTSIGTLSFTNGLAGTAAGNTITFTSNASSMLKDSGSVYVPINFTDGEGNTGIKTIVASVTRVRSAAPLTSITINPQTQTVTSSSVGYSTPQNVTVTLQEVGGAPYTYVSTLGSTINTWSASVVNATINGTTGVITPNTPNTSLGTNASSLVTYINSEGTILTSSISYSVGVALEGNDGGQGPGVVYRGTYVAGTAYFHTDIRRDIVVYAGQYYLANNTAKSGLTTWGTPPTDWTAFGATFDAVATNILLTADATITRGLVMGTLDGFSGFIRSATATSLTAGKGYYFNYDGTFRFGDTGSNVVLWDGTYLTVSGTIKAQTGSIGGVTMSANRIFTGAGTYGNINTGFFLSSSGHFSLEDKLTWDPTTNYLNISGTIKADTGSIGGVTMSANSIFAGVGAYNNKNTGFFLSSSGHFSLEDKLSWDPTTEYLNISGTLRASTGSIGGWTIDSGAIFSGTRRDVLYNQFNSGGMITIGSEGYIVAPGFYITREGGAAFSGSLRANGGEVLTTTNLLLFTASMHSFTASVSSSVGNISASISISVATLDDAIYTNTSGTLDRLPKLDAATVGLITSKDYLGFYSGSAWRTFMSSSGDFYLTGSGTTGLVWNRAASTLSVDGRIIARDGLIGGWKVSTVNISSSNYSPPAVGNPDSAFTTAGIIIGSTGFISSPNFLLSAAGNVVLSGSIAANSGFIGGWVIGGTSLSSTNLVGGSDGVTTTSGIILSREGWISTPNFTVSKLGNVTLTGTVTANAGAIGGWTIDTDSIYVGTKRNSTYNQFNSASMITIGAAGYISAPGFFITTTGLSSFSGSLRANNGQSITTTALLAFTASVTQSLIDASASLSTSIAVLDDAIYTNASGALDRLPKLDAQTVGLITSKDYLGFYSGSAWRTFMSSSGDFYLTGSGTTGLIWNRAASTLSVDGRIIARSGLVGGWGIGTLEISSSNTVGGGDDVFTTTGMRIGSTGYISAQNFKVASNGNASFSGSIFGGNITIGTGNSVFKADLNGIYLGNGTFASAPFRVSPAGALIATNANIQGTITATDGLIGNWDINTNDISSIGATGGSDGTFTTNGIILNKDGWISAKKFFINSSGEASFAGKLSFGARGSGINIAPIVMRYDPRDGLGISSANYDNVASLNGYATENAISYSIDPFGNTSLVWQCYPDVGGAGDDIYAPDGGWNSNQFPIDNTKSYKFIIYVKRYTSLAAGCGNSYWGTYANSVRNLSDSALNANPYFIQGVGGGIALNKWYLAIGYVFGKDYAGTSNTDGGVWDCTTGEKIWDATAFKWDSSATTSNHRAYLYYNTLGDTTVLYQEMWNPSVFEMDGTEPDLNKLLDKGKMVANGNFSGGTFINNTTIYSPIIAGTNGYFAESVKVGTGTDAIVIDGANKKIYQGTGTYGNTNTGFFLDSNGKLSLKDRLLFDGTNLTVDGIINARSGIFSGSLAAVDGKIGGWIIDGNSLRDENSNIKLNPGIPSIEIYDTSDVKRLDIKKGNLSDPAATATISINPPSAYSFSATQYTPSTWPGYGKRLYSTSYFSGYISTGGIYYKASPAWSAGITNFLSTNSTFSGYVYAQLVAEVHTSTTPNDTTLVAMFTMAETNDVSTPSTTSNLTTISTPISLNLTGGVTYYIFTVWILYGYVGSGYVQFTGTPDPASNSGFDLQLDQVEITDGGILVVAGANNYARIARGTSNNTMDIYQNSSTYTGITINNADNSNVNNAGLALNVTNGSVNIAKKLFVQGMVTDPALANLAIKGVTAAGTRYGELFYSTSTRRNKMDIVDWEKQNILEKIKLVQPKKFVYKNWPSGSGKTLGLIAEDLRDFGLEESTVFETDENGNKINDVIGIDWEKISVILWKGVQELTDRVEQLEAKISGSI